MQQTHSVDKLTDPSMKTVALDLDFWSYIISSVRPFARNEILPRAEEMEKQEKIPQDILDSMAKIGLNGLIIPREYGGQGCGVLADCVAVYELAYGDMSVALAHVANTSLCARAIMVGGTEDQKQIFTTIGNRRG